MPRTATPAIPGVEVTTPAPAGCEPILSGDALRFVASLARRFEPTRRDLLARRAARLQELEAGRLPDFLPETRALRERDWTVAPIPPDLQERKVEIRGPVDRKMVINALNSGASVFMAVFEDSHSPTWENTIRGQQNLVDTVNGTISFTGPEGKRYALNERTATLMVRPRGWHLVEKHVLVDGQPVSASLCDFGLCFFHTAPALGERGRGSYWYLPKLESHPEARPRGGIRALGGMAAQTPIRGDPAANAAALEKVRQDKLREVRQGHDGTWVAHPALVPVAREVFDGHVAGAHQIAVRREDVRASAGDLLAVPHGEITEAGLVANIDIGIRYLAAWLGGQGCVPIHNLMEDAATAEISRAQIWQWLRHGARLSDGRAVSERLVRETLARVTQTLPERVGVDPGGAGRFELAARIFEQMATAAEFPEFLTLVAYDYLD